MKLLIVFLALVFVIQLTNGEMDMLVKNKIQTIGRIEMKIDKTFGAALSLLGNKIDKTTKKDPNKKVAGDGSVANRLSEDAPTYFKIAQADESKTLATYGKYDFVQGDRIIFEDDFSTETIGEFPSKWKLMKGSAENIKFGENPCLGFTHVNSQVTPLMKTVNFLPKIFTIEFDIYFYLEGNEGYMLRFGTGEQLELRTQKVSFGPFIGTPNGKTQKGWHHFSIAVNDKKMKVYFDEKRVLNIPEIAKSFVTVDFRALSHGAAKGKPSMLKSLRIAEGGMDLYKRIMTDGKYIARGILFDNNKATLKPQSMGQINEMVNLMNEHPEMKFSIEGHTDSNGDEKSNQKLSEKRAQSVKAQMILMGIDDSKLESIGFGENKPSDDNSTPEGKANNRRVEFIKK